MQRYEYRAITAPGRAEKVKGLKTTAERFAHTLSIAMNDMAREGWEYLRADILPCEERSGLTGRSTVHHTLLVFRRPVAAGPDAAPPEVPLIAGPDASGPAAPAALEPAIRAARPAPAGAAETADAPPLRAGGLHVPGGAEPVAPGPLAEPRGAHETGPLGHAAAFARALGNRVRAVPPEAEAADRPAAPRLVSTAREGSAPRLGGASDGGKQG